MLFEPVVHINSDALKHNLNIVRKQAPHSKIMAVIKANAYGHGMAAAVTGLQDADAFAVARVSEGAELRALEPSKEIVVLTGFNSTEELAQIKIHSLTPVIHHAAQLQMLAQANPQQFPAAGWLKVNTGMNRLGLAVDQAANILTELQSKMPVQGIMTHLANADDLQDNFTQQQLAAFKPVQQIPDMLFSAANSAGLLGWADSRLDWVRPGIMLYGASPLTGQRAADLGLQPVMTFKARVIATRQLKQGDAVGYGGDWQAPQDMPLAIVGVGYGDGYPREVSAGTSVLVKGQRLPVVGRVSMDTLSIDADKLPAIKIGDKVTLWGEGLPVDEIATAANTLAYTLLCGITDRVKRQ